MPSAQPTTQECISSSPILPTTTHIASMPQVGSKCMVFGLPVGAWLADCSSVKAWVELPETSTQKESLQQKEELDSSINGTNMPGLES